MPPTIRNSRVTVANAPASARLTSKLRRISVRTKVMIVKSNASSVQAAEVVRNVFHSCRETSLYQGITGILAGNREPEPGTGQEIRILDPRSRQTFFPVIPSERLLW